MFILRRKRNFLTAEHIFAKVLFFSNFTHNLGAPKYASLLLSPTKVMRDKQIKKKDYVPVTQSKKQSLYDEKELFIQRPLLRLEL